MKEVHSCGLTVPAVSCSQSVVTTSPTTTTTSTTSSSSTSACTAGGCASDEEHEDTWDVAIGQLITGLDADIEKSGGAACVSPPGSVVGALAASAAAASGGGGMGAAGGAKNRDTAAAALHEKGLKMKIKRTACRTGNAADAKHEIVSTSEPSATSEPGLVSGAVPMDPGAPPEEPRVAPRRLTGHRKERRARECTGVRSEEERWENGEQGSGADGMEQDSCQMLDSAAKRIRKTDSPEEFADVSVGTDDNMVSRGTSIDPECLGPCEPGTSVSLEGIVWQETECGVLVVNITWRGKTYVGTLLDCTRQQEWAPPRFTDSPTVELDPRAAKARAKRGRSSGAVQGDVVQLNSGTSLSGGLGACVAETRASKLRATPHAGGTKGRRGAYSNGTTTFSAPNSPARRKGRTPVPTTPSIAGDVQSPARLTVKCELDSDEQSTESTGTNNNNNNNNVASAWIECPETGCAKKFRDNSALLYHQNHAHQSISSSSTTTSSGEKLESSTSAASGQTPAEDTQETTREEESSSAASVPTPVQFPGSGGGENTSGATTGTECDTSTLTDSSVTLSAASARSHPLTDTVDGNLVKKEPDSAIAPPAPSVVADNPARPSVPDPGEAALSDPSACVLPTVSVSGSDKMEGEGDGPLPLTVKSFSDRPASPAYSDISDDTPTVPLSVSVASSVSGGILPARLPSVPSSPQSSLPAPNTASYRSRPLSPAGSPADPTARLPFYSYPYRLPTPSHSLHSSQPGTSGAHTGAAHFSVAGLLEPSRYGAPGTAPVTSPRSPMPGSVRVPTVSGEHSPQLPGALRVPMSTAGFTAPFTAPFVGLPPPTLHGAVGFPPVLLGTGGAPAAAASGVYHPRFPAVLTAEDLSRPGASYNLGVEPSPPPAGFLPGAPGCLEATQRCRRPLVLQQPAPLPPRAPTAPTPPFSAVPVTVPPAPGFLSK